MKTNNIKQWVTLLLTVSGMAALPLTVSAAWSDNGSTAATANGASAPTSGTVAGSVYNGSSGNVLTATNSGTLWGRNLTVNLTGNSTAAWSGGSAGSLIDLDGFTVSGSGVGLFGALARDGARIDLHSGAMVTLTGGVNTYGLASNAGALLQGTAMVIEVTGTVYSNNLNAVRANGGTVNLGDDSRITSHGGIWAMMTQTGLIEGNRVTINSDGGGARVADSGTVHLTNGVLNVSTGFHFARGNNEIIFTGGTITAVHNVVEVGDNNTNGNLIISNAMVSGSTLVNNYSTSGSMDMTFEQVDASNAGGIVVTDANNGTTDVTINGGSGIHGDVTNSGSGALTVNLNDTSLTGSVTGSNAAILNINANNSTLTGDITAADDATLTVVLDNNSTLTGKVDPVDLSVINNSTWNLTADSQVNNLLINSGGKIVFQKDAGSFKTLTVANLTGSGEFHMNTDLDANTGDLLDITGTSAGSHQVRITNHGNNTAGTEPPLLVIRTADGQATFSGTTSVGMFDYSLSQDGNNWYLAASGTNLPPGDVGKDIIANGPGAQAPGWFDHNNNIGGHLTDLRDSARNTTVSGRSGSDKDVTLSAASILNSVWIKAYGAQLNISGRVAGTSVREMDYGTDIGADHQWQLDRNNTLIAGAFVGYGRTDRETRNNFGGEGNTDAFRLGLYGIWLNNSGWFADIIAKGQYNDNTISAYDASYNHTTADFDNWGGGISADFGKRIDFQHGWFIEPSVSAAYAHLTGSDYTTAGDNIFSVTTTDAEVFQFKIGVAFGRTIKLTNSGILQPYVKVAGVEQISTGGKVKASGSEWRPNFDGARAELGAGIIWQLNTQHSLSLDYEASFGDKYDKPWGLTAGYRYQF